MPLSKRLAAEFIGTLWLVLGGCGSAVLAATFPNVGIGLHGVSLAFGLTVLTMAYALGHISGCHLNPAVSFGLWAGKRFSTADLFPYIIAQVLGAIVGAFVIYLIATGKVGFDVVQKRVCRQRLRGPFSGWLFTFCRAGLRDRDDLYVSDRYLGRYPRASACGVCRYRHRSCANAHPLDQHPGDQYLGRIRRGAQGRQYSWVAGLWLSFGFSGSRQSLAPSSPDGPICGLVKKIHQGEFRWRANDHGELDASGARGKSKATEMFTASEYSVIPKPRGEARGSAVNLASDLLATTHPSKGDCANVPT